MARLVHEGNTLVYWITTIADINAPTVAEITAGTNLTSHITKDGVNFTTSGNRVDTPGIDATFDAQVAGSWGATGALKMFRDDTDETDTWDTFSQGLNGYVLIGRFGSVAATEVVEVYPVEVVAVMPEASTANEAQKFSVEFAVTSTPDLTSTVAA